MGIVHHSNYIRYFEEARIDFLGKTGFDFMALEKEGIISPVLSTLCNHKSMAYYGDTLLIKTSLIELGNVKYTFSYTITNKETAECVAVGETSHCFVDASHKIVSLKRLRPEIFEMMKQYAE